MKFRQRIVRRGVGSLWKGVWTLFSRKNRVGVLEIKNKSVHLHHQNGEIPFGAGESVAQ